LTTGSENTEASLARRLSAVAEILFGAPERANRDSQPSRSLLERLVQAVQPECSPDRVWLLGTAVFGAYPTAEEVIAAVRTLQLSTPAEASRWLLQQAVITEAGLVENRRRAVEQERHAQRAARRTEAARRHPRVARGRRALRWAVIRRPLLRRAALSGWRRFTALRARAGRMRRQMRRPAGPPAPVGLHLDADPAGPGAQELVVVADHVLVDVDHAARYDLHTGIQQVVRRTLPIWNRDHAVLPVAWATSGGGLRTLSPSERDRVLRWGGDLEAGPAAADPPLLVVPWRTALVLLETPPGLASERLAAVAQYSGNVLVAVGYDCIPAVSADLVPAAERDRFPRYLSVLKFARRIAGISSSATAEFRGFGAALAAQGLASPTIVECQLPTEWAAPATAAHAAPAGARPLVLSVGLEPRKNPLGVLYAAERLWLEGLDFELRFVAGSAWGDEALERIDELRRQGRRVSMVTALSDAELAASYQQARFTVFVSLHEGFGLPVAESLAFGTPVITSGYGGTREVAAGGGAVLVDPRDDEALVNAMRCLLTDQAVLEGLRRQIAARPVRTWEQYAAELWGSLVEPPLRTLGAEQVDDAGLR
jgi:glycosyltransferase involved in cell wall biosynthesis